MKQASLATTAAASIAHIQCAIEQPHTALIRRPEVERLTALSRSRLYALIALNEFPKPIRLGAMSVAWAENEVHIWIAQRIADSRKAA